MFLKRRFVIAYGWDTVCCFLFVHGFLRRDFTDRREIWHEASPISQTGLLKFLGRSPSPKDSKEGKIVALNMTSGRIFVVKNGKQIENRGKTILPSFSEYQ